MNSKKQFDYIEDKIRQAAEQHSPAFDDKAWEKMEALLDKKERKRRPLLWWTLPVLMIAGIGAYLLLHTVNTPGTSIPEKQTSASVPATDTKKAEALSADAVPSSTNNNPVLPAPAEQSTSVVNKEQSQLNKSTEKDNIVVSGTSKLASSNDALPATAVKQTTAVVATDQERNAPGEKYASKKIIRKRKGKKTIQQVSGEQDESVADNIPETKAPAATVAATNADNVSNVLEEKAPAVIAPVTKEEEKKTTPLAADNKKNTEEEKPRSAKNENKHSEKYPGGLYVLATAGTDAGMMHLFSFAKSTIVPKYGIGLGYQLNKRFSIQTGFYISNKKYTAGAGDYKVKAGSYWDNVQINSIEAACKVYEIPLQLRVNLIQRKSVSLFGTIGVSSYIMKKEDYDCKYTAWGYNRESYWYYKGNSHLFSSLIFSAGIEKKVNNKLSILAEPSFAVPLSGVGEGKVRLYSAALQTGIRYFPFVKRK